MSISLSISSELGLFDDLLPKYCAISSVMCGNLNALRCPIGFRMRWQVSRIGLTNHSSSFASLERQTHRTEHSRRSRKLMHRCDSGPILREPLFPVFAGGEQGGRIGQPEIGHVLFPSEVANISLLPDPCRGTGRCSFECVFASGNRSFTDGMGGRINYLFPRDIEEDDPPKQNVVRNTERWSHRVQHAGTRMAFRVVNKGKAPHLDGFFLEVINVSFMHNKSLFLWILNKCFPRARFPNQRKIEQLVL